MYIILIKETFTEWSSCSSCTILSISVCNLFHDLFGFLQLRAPLSIPVNWSITKEHLNRMGWSNIMYWKKNHIMVNLSNDTFSKTSLLNKGWKMCTGLICCETKSKPPMQQSKFNIQQGTSVSTQELNSYWFVVVILLYKANNG